MEDVRRDIQYVQENRVLTSCGYAGSVGQGFMEDVRRDIQRT